MEIIIVVAMLSVFGYILGVDLAFILEALLGLMAVTMLLTTLFFIITAISLIGSKRRRVTFERIDKAEGSVFRTAVYKDGETEYRNTFPSELMLKDLLYKKDKTVSVRVTKKGKTYDFYSLLTIYIGLVLAPVSVIGLCYYFFWAGSSIFAFF